MKKTNLWHVAIMSMGLLFASCQKSPVNEAEDPLNETVSREGLDEAADLESASVKVFATGLNNPRGLKFGPDGHLYVAEGGVGGSNSTIGICDQVPFPVGPFTGSPTGGRISRINKHGVRHTVTDNLPSAKGNEISGGSIIGVADVAFVGHQMYALLAAGGCAHGVPSIPNAVIKVKPNGNWHIVANLSNWFKNNPAADPDEGDFDPDGGPQSMISVGFNLYVMEANSGQLLKVSPWGHISRVVDISAAVGHIVPTTVAFNGHFIFGNLGIFPIVDGSSSLYRLKYSGEVDEIATGFSTIMGVCFDRWGRIYVLQNTTGNPFPTPGTGSIIRINHFGQRKTIATGLTLPTGMTFGPDGKLYVSNVGFGPAAIGGGEILQISLRRSHDEW